MGYMIFRLYIFENVFDIFYCHSKKPTTGILLMFRQAARTGQTARPRKTRDIRPESIATGYTLSPFKKSI